MNWGRNTTAMYVQINSKRQIYKKILICITHVKKIEAD
jgi:ribosomal protein L21E